MRVLFHSVRTALFICGFLALGAPAFADDIEPSEQAPPVEENRTALSVEMVKGRAERIAASAGLDEVTRGALAQLYLQVIASLEAIAANRAAAERFESSIQSSRSDAVRLRAELAQKREQTHSKLPALGSLSLADAELKLQEAKAERAKVWAQLGNLRSRIDKEKERPAVINQLIDAAKRQIAEIESGSDQQAAGQALPEVTQARGWVNESRLEQFRSEILMLDQERASQPVRLESLRAQLDLTEINLADIQKKVVALEAAANQARLEETEQAKIKALAAEITAVGKHPLLIELAGRNRQLSEQIDALAGAIENLEKEKNQHTVDAAANEQRLEETRQKIDVAGVSQIMGQLLQEQRRSLPDINRLKKQRQARERKIAQTTLSKFLLEEERRQLRDLDTYVTKLSSDTPPEDAEAIAGELNELAASRRLLVDKALKVERAYLQTMAELDFAQQRLTTSVERFNGFLDKRLLWVRSTEVVGLDTARRIPGQLMDRLSPDKWRDVLSVLKKEVVSVTVAMIILFIAGLRAGRHWLLRLLEQSGKNVGNLLQDRLRDTLRALLIIALLALPWPLFLMLTGQLLLMSENAASFTKAVGQVLEVVAPLLFQLKILEFLVAPGSVAAVHFGWRERGL
ncbi:MAG: hypothetical protein KJN79_06870, partial [Gammaproteobacteria bacterium]|nr:hypothetical protein [Gammaproteobacteria bacterium]